MLEHSITHHRATALTVTVSMTTVGDRIVYDDPGSVHGVGTE